MDVIIAYGELPYYCILNRKPEDTSPSTSEANQRSSKEDVGKQQQQHDDDDDDDDVAVQPSCSSLVRDEVGTWRAQQETGNGGDEVGAWRAKQETGNEGRAYSQKLVTAKRRRQFQHGAPSSIDARRSMLRVEIFAPCRGGSRRGATRR